jgi:hypothetical protein
MTTAMKTLMRGGRGCGPIPKTHHPPTSTSW